MHAYKHHGQKQFQETSRVPVEGQRAPGLIKQPAVYYSAPGDCAM